MTATARATSTIRARASATSHGVTMSRRGPNSARHRRGAMHSRSAGPRAHPPARRELRRMRRAKTGGSHDVVAGGVAVGAAVVAVAEMGPRPRARARNCSRIGCRTSASRAASLPSTSRTTNGPPAIPPSTRHRGRRRKNRQPSTSRAPRGIGPVRRRSSSRPCRTDHPTSHHRRSRALPGPLRARRRRCRPRQRRQCTASTRLRRAIGRRRAAERRRRRGRQRELLGARSSLSRPRAAASRRSSTSSKPAAPP